MRINLALENLYTELQTGRHGLTAAEAGKRLNIYGPNVLEKHSSVGALSIFLRFFLNPLVLILLVSALLSLYLGETRGSVIIVTLLLASAIFQFFHEYRSHNAAAALSKRVAIHASVLRDGGMQEILLSEVVPGDIIQLSAGDIIPGDARLISAKDLYINQASLTGESFAVAKKAAPGPRDSTQLTDMDYAVFMGCNVTTGSGTAVIVATGKNTEIGKIAHSLSTAPPETQFQQGIRAFSLMLMRIIISLVLMIFFLNALLKHNYFESFLFAIAVSVGLTPELLPAIMTVNLANGAMTMSRKGVIVKWLASIQNLGSMDVLCSDKTGTLTEGDFKLVEYVDIRRNSSDITFLYAYLTSFLQSGLKNPLDLAITQTKQPPEANAFQKIDEIPFDFVRRMMSVIVANEKGEHLLITKGAPESILDHSVHFLQEDGVTPLDPEARKQAVSLFNTYSAQGYKVIGVAYKLVEHGQASFELRDESNLIFLGFLAFFDPPKASVGQTVEALKELKVNIKILTGDNEIVTKKVCADVGIPVHKILTGNELDRISDEALSRTMNDTSVFARLNPVQKNRIIHLLKRKGHVVGYIGDGINDAPSLHTADVGISVNNAVDVAKESAAVILLEKNLDALKDGIIEGRKTFANTMKYIMMGTSSNFGNMASMAAASLMVPFLPMTPVQILLNNLLYDFSQVAIPTDKVDDESIARPQKWDIKFIRLFMFIFGPISSLFDVLTFSLLYYVFQATESIFQTGWFIESLATQVLVIHIIRSRRNFLKSRASYWLTLSTLGVVCIGFILPFTPLGVYLGFTPIPLPMILAIVLMVIIYLLIVDTAKIWFYRKYAIFSS